MTFTTPFLIFFFGINFYLIEDKRQQSLTFFLFICFYFLQTRLKSQKNDDNNSINSGDTNASDSGKGGSDDESHGGRSSQSGRDLSKS